jgi:hypothetical protein
VRRKRPVLLSPHNSFCVCHLPSTSMPMPCSFLMSFPFSRSREKVARSAG